MRQMRAIPSAHNVAVLSGDFEAFGPETLFDYWTKPELLTQWWSDSASLEPTVGGHYRNEWPDMGWVMEGEFTAFEPGSHLGFTWNWNHEPHKTPRQVDVYFRAIEEGTRIAIYHGPYGEEDVEQADRKGVIEGWIHFGMRLAGLKQGAAT